MIIALMWSTLNFIRDDWTAMIHFNIRIIVQRIKNCPSLGCSISELPVQNALTRAIFISEHEKCIKLRFWFSKIAPNI